MALDVLGSVASHASDLNFILSNFGLRAPVTSAATSGAPDIAGALGQLESPKKRRLDIDCIASPVKSRRLSAKSTSISGCGTSSSSLAGAKAKLCGRAKALKLQGPSAIQTLRGRFHGREIALVFCGEAHEDAIDLTREKSIVSPEEGWIDITRLGEPGLNPCQALETKRGLTLSGAKKWAAAVIEELDEAQAEGAKLLFHQKRAQGRGIARIFLQAAKHSADHPMERDSLLFEWGDLDAEAREFNRRRMAADKDRVSIDEQDELIAQRKAARRHEGFELFDDWLLRQARSQEVKLEFILEAPVSADELQLHIDDEELDSKADPRLRQMEPDSDEDSEEAKSPGNGSYLDYLRRHALRHLAPEQRHFVDARVLGDADDDNLPPELRGSFDSLASKAPKRADTEEFEASSCEAAWQGPAARENPLPSWEAFFGGAADLLYYAPHIKADYAPFLSDCVGSPEKLRNFFQHLYFGTVPEALSTIRIREETLPSTHVRSLVLEAAGTRLRRPAGHCKSGRCTIPVRKAPIHRYLTARGFDTPRTWVAGIAESLRKAGAESFVEAARSWYQKAVDEMLGDPKAADLEGDNFAAWLRACHREVYDDIDTYDPVKLKRLRSARGKSNGRRYNIKDIQIPGVDDAFAEFAEGSSGARQQVLSKMVVDSFQLRSVDLAMVLKAAEVALRPSRGEKLVIVQYAGLDHTRAAVKFWRSQGFKATGLGHRGLVGKEIWEDDEPRALSLPPYLQDLSKLFPVPKSLRDLEKKSRLPLRRELAASRQRR